MPEEDKGHDNQVCRRCSSRLSCMRRVGTDFEIFGKLVYFRRDVEKDEVNPIPVGGIGVIHDQGHALSPFRSFRPS